MYAARDPRLRGRRAFRGTLLSDVLEREISATFLEPDGPLAVAQKTLN